MSIRSWSPALAWIAVSLAACQLAVGDADLSAVQCVQSGVIGAPACAPGQICAGTRCVPCGTAEVCGNGFDDDCDGQIDEGCPGIEAGQDSGQPDHSAWPESGSDTSSGGTAGSGGADASAGQAGAGASTGATGGTGGTGGDGGTGATGGDSGAGGSAGAGGTGGTGGGGNTGGTGGTEPTCKPMGASCMPGSDDCCNGYCCTVYQSGHCFNNVGQKCSFPGDCCTNKCLYGYCSL